MNPDITAEVIDASHHASGNNSSLVSRKSIEYQILDNPGMYPFLTLETQTNRRNIISRIMNARHPCWTDSPEKKSSSLVWKIREIRETRETRSSKKTKKNREESK